MKRIKLGLDLQGGMRVVLEVNTVKLLEKLANNPDDAFRKILAEAGKEAALSNESVVELVGNKFQEKGIRELESRPLDPIHRLFLATP